MNDSVTYLCQSRYPGHALQEGLLFSVSELQVHRFVCVRGKLIAEADLVNALRSRGVGEVVILLLLLIIQDVVLRISDKAVHIIVAP